MGLDYTFLAESLKKLRDENGRGFYTELQALSNVANIGRYARGDKNASFDTWLRLHNALPDKIPAPCYEERAVPLKMKSTGDNNRLVQTSTYNEGRPEYSEELAELIKLLDQYAPKVYVKKLLRKWRAEKHQAEKA